MVSLSARASESRFITTIAAPSLNVVPRALASNERV